MGPMRGLRLLGYGLMLAGLLLLAWPGFSYLSGRWHQARLLAEVLPGQDSVPLADEPEEWSVPVETPPPVGQAPDPSPTPHQPRAQDQAATPAQPAAAPSQPRLLLEIPALNLRQAVLADVDNRSLDRGPGHYPRSALPDKDGGNVAIAGHRTIKGAPSYFYRLDRLGPGDTVRLIYDGVIYRYQVEELFIVDPQDTYVLNPVGYKALTLTTCDPPGTDERRLIVRAKLVGEEPAS